MCRIIVASLLVMVLISTVSAQLDTPERHWEYFWRGVEQYQNRTAPDWQIWKSRYNTAEEFYQSPYAGSLFGWLSESPALINNPDYREKVMSCYFEQKIFGFKKSEMLLPGFVRVLDDTTRRLEFGYIDHPKNHKRSWIIRGLHLYLWCVAEEDLSHSQ